MRRTKKRLIALAFCTLLSMNGLGAAAKEIAPNGETVIVAEETRTPEPMPEPTKMPEATEIPEPTEMPDAAEVPAETPVPEENPEPTDAPEEEEAPECAETSEPEAVPVPSEAPDADEPVGEEAPVTEESEEQELLEAEESEILTDETKEEPEIRIRRKRLSEWYGVVPSDERGMPIPMLFQGDYRDAVCVIDGKARSVSSSGCGATSLSMVIAYFTGNTSQTPYTLFCEAYDEGRYHGSGWNHETLSVMALRYGVKGCWVGRDRQMILAALGEGKPVIAHMGEGIFTENGHYVVLRGVTEEGKILVNDPASRERTRHAYPIETILKQSKTDMPFMICRAAYAESTEGKTENAEEQISEIE